MLIFIRCCVGCPVDQPRVVIFSSHSLFTDGVAMRLKQHLGAGEIQFVDVRQPGALERVAAAQPSTVIMDAGDASPEARCSLSKLLDAVPALRIIRLDPQREQVQVVTSDQRAVASVNELVKVLKSSPAGA